MTFDTTSKLGVPTPPENSPNTRTPALDLDSVYGFGPTASPHLYHSKDRDKFKVESNGQFEDLPRDSDGRAIIADPRNDENLMIAGLHVAFLLFHNRVVDRLRQNKDFLQAVESGQSDGDDLQSFGGRGDGKQSTFSLARREVAWHYQWIILHEFLPRIIGSSLVENILYGGQNYYTKDEGGRMPVEFQGAVYRFGHSLVRPSYRANLAGDQGQPFFGFIFVQLVKTSPILWTCVAGPGCQDASSAGRLFSISEEPKRPMCGRPR